MSLSSDTADALAEDVARISQISSIPALLQVICNSTGLGFAAVARVTDQTWMACAVRDEISFGLLPGGQLDLHSTLCFESRAARAPVVIDHASQDPAYCNHHTPRTYNIESYISVPIILGNGDYFGNLCAIDPKPAHVSGEKTLALFTGFAALIAVELDAETNRAAASAALLEAQTAAHLREQFIAVLSHDLRNPLAAISATSKVIAYKSTDSRARFLAERIGVSVTRMSELINHVMDLARAKSDLGFNVVMQEISDIGPELQVVIDELKAAYPERVVTSTVVVSTPVRCDASRFQQLLSNLLANALTHGAADKPVVVDISESEDGLNIRVVNEGEPIPEDHLSTIFQPYKRPVSARRVGGLGLGLYICAQIVKAHEGHIYVTSSRERGTTFFAELPVLLRNSETLSFPADRELKPSRIA